MMLFKRFVIFALIACLSLGLCACGGAGDTPETTGTPETTAAVPETTVDDGKVTYTVRVVDADGNPIANAAVQICKETCLPGMTNDEGMAVFNVVEDDYKVSFMTVPAGFEAEAEEFYFEAGSYELTITLKAAA